MDEHKPPVDLARLWQKHHLVFWTALGGVFILSGALFESQGRVLAGHILFALGYLSGGWMAAKESFDGLRQYRLDVNVLMTLAAVGAAVIGRWAEGGILIFLFSLSNTLEHYALEKTKDAVRALMDLRPAEARVLVSEGTRQVPVEELNVGDEILIKPGEKIPADGAIIDGSTTVDRSTFTGESMPVDCVESDFVLAGTLNLTGQIRVRVSKRAADTALAAIIHRVEQAQSGRVPTNSFVAWFGQRYTIGFLAGAALLIVASPFLFEMDWKTSFYRSLTLLVVASPCALIISTPAAVLSAIGRGARKGVLFKGGNYLLALGSTKAVAFDKTGTLTQARAVVTDVVPLNGTTSGVLVTLAGSIESGSTHPLAQAIIAEARRCGLSMPEVTGASTIAGLGATGTVTLDGTTSHVKVGNRQLLAAHDLRPNEEAEQLLQRFENEGKTAVLVGSDRLLGIIALEDPPRRSAAMIARQLHAVGVRSVGMLTGDNRRVAAAMAQRLEINQVQAELLPDHKADAVIQMVKEHESVAVVGDGVNDAPALALATVGVAMGGAKNDVVLETADVVLMGDDLSRLPFAIRLSQATRRIIIQNITFALIVITLLLIGTFRGEIPLTVGVIGHEGSTLLVVLNSLRILIFK
jgi:Cd2+/Zn2+-exporting ATPase